MFSTLSDAIDFYNKYGEESGFDVNLSSQKRYNDGTVRIRYLNCSRAGFTETFKHDSINESESCKRKTTSKRIGCPAIIKFKNLPGSSKFYVYGFVEEHNHNLVSKENLYLLRNNRKLDFLEQSFIHRVGTNNIGATRAYTVLSNIKGGYDVRGGIAIDFKNFKRDLNCKIGDSDAQILVDKMENRKSYVPNFSFEYKVEKGYLSCLFWADETAKRNYEEFGDIISLDATFRTNK